MKIVRMHEAKTHFSALVREVLAGEEVVVYRGNEPVVKLVPAGKSHLPRKPGALAGAIRIADDFDELPEAFADYVG
jgi:prevent-host-death family protein